MTDLHRYVDHGSFRPPWEELNTESFRDRLLMIEAIQVGHGTSFSMRVVSDQKRTRCRLELSHQDQYGVRGTILFEFGSTKPVGYTGSGVCATEPLRRRSDDSSHALNKEACIYHEDATIALHGLAWRGERNTENAAKELSLRRAELMQRTLNDTALPHDVSSVEAHGTERTDVSFPTDNPVPGVYLAMDDPEIADAEKPFRFHDYEGPPISDELRAEFAAFMEFHVSRPEIPALSTHGTKMSVSYISPQGYKTKYYGEPFIGERPALHAVYEWTQALIEHNCKFDRVDSPKAFLPSGH